jgi:hypothetical protein
MARWHEGETARKQQVGGHALSLMATIRLGFFQICFYIGAILLGEILWANFRSLHSFWAV